MSPFHTILVPVDFSPHSEAALTMAVDLARRFEARIHLLHCYEVTVGSLSPYSETDSDEFNQRIRDAAHRELESWRHRTREEGVSIEEHLSEHHPVIAIPDLADELDADLIVLGSLGRTGIRRLLLGSIAERVVRVAPCPVLTVRHRSASGIEPDGPIDR